MLSMKSSIAVSTPLRGPPSCRALSKAVVHFTRGQCGLAIHHSGTPERLTILHRNRTWLVVHITATVWPADVVVQRHRPLLAVLIEELQLVEDRVPVVVAVDQGGARIRDRAKRIEARSTMHDKRIRVISFHLAQRRTPGPGSTTCRTAPHSSAQRTRSCVWLPAAAPTSTIVAGLSAESSGSTTEVQNRCTS